LRIINKSRGSPLDFNCSSAESTKDWDRSDVD